MRVLASLLGSQSDQGDLFALTLVILVVIAVLIGAIALVRKYMLAPVETENDPMAGFSLASLRKLVKEGKMTPEEFDAAKTQIVAAAQKASERKKPIDHPAPEPKLPPDEPI